MDTSQQFIGRETSVKQLADGLLNKGKKNELVDIISISGQPGVGKSYLLDYTMDSTNLDGQQYLALRLSGPSENEGNPRTLCELLTQDLIARCPVDTAKEPFKRLKKCRKILERLDRETREQITAHENQIKEQLPPEVRELFLKLGLGIVELVSNGYFAAYVSELLKKNPDAVEDIVKQASTLFANLEEKGLISKLKEAFESEIATKLRSTNSEVLREVLAIEFADDLADLFEEQRKKEKTEKKYSKLLLILDDYEALSESLGAFLFGNKLLIPKLMSKNIETVIVILCREEFWNLPAHLGSKDKVREHLSTEIKLEPFNETEARGYISAAGIKDENDISKIIADTDCLPFLLESEVRAYVSGENRALTVESYYARFTRWMSPFQREWLTPLSFLEIINENSIKAMLPGENEVNIMNWVKNNPSIRSSKKNLWTIKKAIRRCVQERLLVTSPDAYDKLKEKADIVNRETEERYKKYEKAKSP